MRGPTSSTPAPRTGPPPGRAARTARSRPKKVVAVCGPTAAGKSPLSDGLADGLSGRWGSRVPVVVVDSMQVYSGIGEISNQARERPAELVSVVPVTERWTVARHAAAVGKIMARTEHGAVLDAGTGMYLNAIILEVPMAPQVPDEVRKRAERASALEENPRRASRELELRWSGAAERGSIWEGDLTHDTALLYVRPSRDDLDASIARRSRKIVARGREEARGIRALQKDGHTINPSVLEAVGVKELLMVVDGDLPADEATERISARTRRLARRQMRWFDKLAKTVEGRAVVTVVPEPGGADIPHTMHGIVGDDERL